jgi:hypothetical protein
METGDPVVATLNMMSSQQVFEFFVAFGRMGTLVSTIALL